MEIKNTPEFVIYNNKTEEYLCSHYPNYDDCMAEPDMFWTKEIFGVNMYDICFEEIKRHAENTIEIYFKKYNHFCYDREDIVIKELVREYTIN